MEAFLAALDVANRRLEQQEEAVVLGLIGTETGITALEALGLTASECHDSERYSLLERIEAFLEEQLRADALDLLVVGQAGWAEHDHRLPLLQGAARGMQLAASEVLPLFGSGAGLKLPMLTLRVEEETGDLRIRTEVLEVPVWQLPMPSGEQLELVVVPAGESTIGSAAEEAGHDVYSPGCAACEVRHELSQRNQASAWSWLVHLDKIIDLNEVARLRLTSNLLPKVSMQSSQRDITWIWQHLSEALRSDSGEFQSPGQVFLTDQRKRNENSYWGQGVVVRNMDDGLTKDENFNVVPGTFWHDDIWPPNQIYPWSDGSGNGTDIMGGDNTGNGAWVTPTLAVAIGPEHFNAIFNSPDLQVANWTDGVWYAHDSNSCDKRALYCKGTDEKGYYEGYECPGAWVDLKNYISGNPFIFTPDTTKLGSGFSLAGNPYNPDKDNPGKNFGGGGTGMHCMYSYSDVLKGNPQYEYQINGSKEDPLLPNCLFADYSCQINYSAWNTSTTGIMEDSVEGWHPWIKRFRESAEALQKPVCAWAADLAIGWMNNPRPMITLQNALWKYREEWCDNDSKNPPNPNDFNHYWGWNEIPFSRVPIKDPDNCTCFIIVLPPNDKNLYITLSQWLLDYPYVAQNLIDQLDKYEMEGYSNFQSGVSQVLVVKQIPNDSPNDSVWRRWFCVEKGVEILRSIDKETKGRGWKIDQDGVIQKMV